MKFLSRAVTGEEPDANSGLEETYERLFAKIGRDFIYKEDFYRIMEEVLMYLDPTVLLAVNLRDDSEARARASEYKLTLEAGIDGASVYKDLIDMSED